MKFNKLSYLALVSVAFLAVGCSKKKDVKVDEIAPSTSESSPVTKTDIDSGRADSDSENAMGLKTVHFPYDSYEIVGEALETVKGNIKVLKDNPTVNVQIEGHCDERGGIQYNLALGEKRANALIRQLEAGGIAKSRIAMISMGKEKPVMQGTGEDVWAKNRRGNFVITSK